MSGYLCCGQHDLTGKPEYVAYAAQDLTSFSEIPDFFVVDFTRLADDKKIWPVKIDFLKDDSKVAEFFIRSEIPGGQFNVPNADKIIITPNAGMLDIKSYIISFYKIKTR